MGFARLSPSDEGARYGHWKPDWRRVASKIALTKAAAVSTGCSYAEHSNRGPLLTGERITALGVRCGSRSRRFGRLDPRGRDGSCEAASSVPIKSGIPRVMSDDCFGATPEAAIGNASFRSEPKAAIRYGPTIRQGCAD